MFTVVLFTGTVNALNSKNLNVTLFGKIEKSITLGIGSATYPALYTSSAQHDTEFSFITSRGSSVYRVAPVGATFTVTALGTVENDVVIIKLRNRFVQIFNDYSGIAFY